VEDKKPSYAHNQGKLLDLNAYYDESLKPIEQDNETKELTLTQMITAQPLPITKEQVIEDLKRYPAHNLDNNLWFEVLAALHHQFSGNETGLKIANYWSSLDKRPNQYKGLEEITKIWQRLSTNKSVLINWSKIKMRLNKLEKVKIKNITQNLQKINPALFPEPNMYFTDEGKPKYKPKCSVNNSNFLFNYYGIKFRNNLVSKDIEGIYQDKLIEDMELLIAHVSGMFAINDFPTKDVKLYINYEAKKNPYNPFKEFVLSKPWDKQDRLQLLFDTVTVEDEYLKTRDIFLNHWFLELIKLTCFNENDTYQFTKSLLVFQCEKYSVGKTEWFNYLVPQKYRNKFIHDGALLKTNDPMSKLECLKVVICELGEVGQTLRKQDADSLKAFISSRQDVLNRKYAITHQTFRRMTIFCATTNDTSFLNNKEGDGRFLVLPIVKCNAYHDIDMQQVYVQLYDIYQKEGAYILTEEHRKLQEGNNENFVQPCHIEDIILKTFDFETEERALRINCSEIFNMLNLPQELAIRNKNILNKIGTACRKHNIYKCSHTNKFYMPPIKNKVEF
jgi:putative DNA primase/helicase